jgi:hypothetical protein
VGTVTELAIHNLSGFEHFQAFVKECNRWARRNNRVTVKWSMPEAIVNPMWDAWYLGGGYNSTNNGPSSLYEPCLRMALAFTPPDKRIAPVFDGKRKTVTFRIDEELLEELSRRSKQAGLDVADYAARLLADVLPNMLAATARNMLNRELGDRNQDTSNER